MRQPWSGRQPAEGGESPADGRAAMPARLAAWIPGARWGRPERLLRRNPVLLLSRLHDPARVAELVAAWNPAADRDDARAATVTGEDGGGLPVADGVHWHGPIDLTPIRSADARLPGGWAVGYAARAARQRERVPDGARADVLRERYPQGVPIGAELTAWRLVRGLARILRGVARLPGCEPYVGRAADTAYVVYGNEALPWMVLREVLGLVVPDLARNGARAANDYTLEQPGLMSVRVVPAGPVESLPYALRVVGAAERLASVVPPRRYDAVETRAPTGVPAVAAHGTDGTRGGPAVAGGWCPHTVYRFRALPTAGMPIEQANVRRAQCAQLLAQVVGGVLLDGDGFPVDQSRQVPMPPERDTAVRNRSRC